AGTRESATGFRPPDTLSTGLVIGLAFGMLKRLTSGVTRQLPTFDVVSSSLIVTTLSSVHAGPPRGAGGALLGKGIGQSPPRTRLERLRCAYTKRAVSPSRRTRPNDPEGLKLPVD